MSNKWFDVDKNGLRKVLARRDSSFIIYELIQNAWDEDCTRVDISFLPIGYGAYSLKVEDNSPEGFSDLSDAFTLFAESKKKNKPETRGRFNVGEKMVIACCDEAKISTTTGTLTFKKDGTRRRSSAKTVSGTVFEATIKLPKDDYEKICKDIKKLIPPKNTKTVFNNCDIANREPVCCFEETLSTEIADVDGDIRKSKRKTLVEVYEIAEGETASIYEMGIPVVETGDKYHVNVMQKVPLNIDRDNVNPSFLLELRTHVLNHTYSRMSEVDASSQWIGDALSSSKTETEAIKHIINKRFGDNAVTYDPSDVEGTKIAASKGMTVVPGGTFNSSQWASIKRAGVIPPAGHVTPSPKPFSECGKPIKIKDRKEWTEGMFKVESYVKMLGKYILSAKVNVRIATEASWPYLATYAKGDLVLNLGQLGKRFFDNFPQNMEDVDDLIIHEFGHHYSLDHLSSQYHEALSFIGAKMKKLALERPEFFHMFQLESSSL